MAKVQVESEYYLNLESDNKKGYKKLIISNGKFLPDPNVFGAGWRAEVHHLAT